MRKVGVSVLFVLISVGLALAQLPSGTILGVVKDPSGGVVPGAKVTARNIDTGQTRTDTTETDGSYRFDALPVGNYEVIVTAKGFQQAVHTGLTLTVGQDVVANVALQVGSASQTVTVTTQAPLVNTTSGSLGGLVNEARVSNLPLNGRNYLDLTLLQPGINIAQNRSAGEAAWISSNGAPVVSNYYLLDGTPTRNLYGRNPSSQTATVLGVDSIKEFRLVSDAMPAQYGMSMGSELVVVSKSGTNQFHGDVFEYLRNSALDARNFYEPSVPPFKRNQFGASLGGPIQKDKTFFFANWESLHERLGVTLNPLSLEPGCIQPANSVVWNGVGTQPAGSVGPCPQLGPNPTDATLPYTVTVNPAIAPIVALFPPANSPGGVYQYVDNRPLLDNFGNGRIDHTFSANDSMFVRFTTDHATQTYQSQPYPPWTDIPNSQNYWITAGETHIFSPSLLSTARFSWAGTRLATDGPMPFVGPQTSLVSGQPLGDIILGQLGGTMLGPDPPLPIIYRQYIWTGSDDLFYTHGKHSLKFGVLINRFTQEPIANVFTRGLVVFHSVANILQGQPSLYRGLTLAPGTTTARQYRFWTYGFYTQDDYRATSRLTLNLGLRYEFNTTIREVNGLEYSIRNSLTGATPIHGALMNNHSLHNFSPRVGFAWDVFGNGKTAVRGGYALLYDIANLADLLGLVPIGEPPLSFQSYNFAPSSFSVPLTFPTPGNSLDMIDYNLQQPSMNQFNLTVEQQLPWDMALTVTYAGSLGRHLIISSSEGNPIVPAGVPSGSGASQTCVPRPSGQALNLTSFVYGSATACFLDTTTPSSPYYGFPQPRVNPNWSSIGYRTADRNSVYHALEVEVNKRLSHGLQFQSAFTWSKSIDQMENVFGSDNAFTEDAGITDAYHPITDMGPSVFDVGKNWRFNMLYNFPTPHSSGFVNKALGGWWVSGIETILTGYPFTPCLSFDQSQQGFDNNSPCATRPNIVPGRSLSSITSGTSAGCTTIGGVTVAPGTPLGTPNMWYDPCAFTLQPSGFLGTAGRNILRGPGEVNLDLTIAKDTKAPFLGESGSIEFRADFFNIFNKANYQFGNNGQGNALSVDGSAPGRLIDTATTPRQIQFALKLLF